MSYHKDIKIRRKISLFLFWTKLISRRTILCFKAEQSDHSAYTFLFTSMLLPSLNFPLVLDSHLTAPTNSILGHFTYANRQYTHVYIQQLIIKTKTLICLKTAHEFEFTTRRILVNYAVRDWCYLAYWETAWSVKRWDCGPT